MPETKLKAPIPTVLTLRTPGTQARYMKAWEDGKIRGLHEMEPMRAWKYWLLVDNDYPYDITYKTHHMLIPRRKVSLYNQLTWWERRELRKIIDTYCQQNYSLVFENMNQMRTIKSVYHLHCATYYPAGARKLEVKEA